MINLDEKKNITIKRETYESVYVLYKGRELTFNAFKRGIFPIKTNNGEGLKIVTLKQMLQDWPLALPQVKTDSTA